MPRVEPLSREELSEFEPFFRIVEEGMAFVPRSLFTMGRSPALPRAFAGLTGTILGGGRIEPGPKALVSYAPSADRCSPPAAGRWASMAERTSASASS